MINTSPAFTRLNLGTSSGRAVQEIRDLVNASKTPTTKASELIKMIVGVETTYTDPTRARLIAMSVADEAFKVNHQIADAEDFIKLCEARVDAFMTRVENAWMFATKGVTHAQETVQVIDGIEMKVALKANGKIKKGGKEILAHELYKKHVLEAPTALTNQEFITVLMKQLDMSKAGATTYAWSCKKKLGEPAGGLVKAKKGRKAKPV